MRRALPIALAAALAFPVAASAHATLQSTTPRFGKEVQRGPVLIRLHFDQHVRVLPGAVKVLNGVGRNFAGTSSAHGTDVVASVTAPAGRPAPRMSCGGCGSSASP